MRSSTSNFDLAALTRAVAAAVSVIAIAWMILPGKFASDEMPAISVETLNELIVEQYTNEYSHKSIVLVGSSIQTMIPPFTCRPDNVAAIYLQGRSGATGLEAILRLGAKPEVVFMETATLATGVDRDVLDVVFRPIYWHVRSLVPPLRHNRNWFVLLYRQYM